MPKTVKFVKDGTRRLRVVVATKFRIGTRSNGTSANLMSNTELNAVIADASKSKWHNSAKAVLANRV